MSKTDAASLARLFKALSVETRVRIVQLLKAKPFCVNALAARLNVTQSAVSQHLRILRDAGLVTADKHGYFVHYSLDKDTLRKWSDQLSELLDASGVERQEGGEQVCATRNSVANTRTS